MWKTKSRLSPFTKSPPPPLTLSISQLKGQHIDRHRSKVKLLARTADIMAAFNGHPVLSTLLIRKKAAAADGGDGDDE